jgi:hypothetical protein
VAAIEAELAEANKPLNEHYDATREVRAKGAGFYQFSGDAETRARQMEEFAAARKTTEQTRKERGAVDLRPGEVEGMLGEEEEGGEIGKSRAMEKRKRDIEERRKALDSKRRKVKGLAASEDAAGTPTPPARSDARQSSSPFPAVQGPFAALEAQASASRTTSKVQTGMSQADEFLAQLERDMAKGRR